MAPEDRRAAVEARLRELRLRFEAGLPGRLAAMERCCDTLAAAPGDRDALDTLHHLAHALTGAAGSFGHEELGSRARALERATRAWLDRDDPPDADALRQFGELIRRMQAD